MCRRQLTLCSFQERGDCHLGEADDVAEHCGAISGRGAHDGLARRGRQGAARLALLAHQVLTQRYVWRLLTTSSDSPRMLTPWFESCGPRGVTLRLTIWAGSTRNGETQKRLSVAERSDAHPQPWLEWLKTGPLLDPLCKEPRFQAIERELKFPQ